MCFSVSSVVYAVLRLVWGVVVIVCLSLFVDCIRCALLVVCFALPAVCCLPCGV